MAGSNSSVHGGNHGDEEPPVARAELRQMANSLLEAMERMFNECLPAAGGRGPQHQHEDNHREEFGDENSGFGNGFRDHFRDGRGGRGGGRHADYDDQHGGGHGSGHHVHFDDEEEIHNDSNEGFDDNENPFAGHGRFGQRQHHRRGAGHDGR